MATNTNDRSLLVGGIALLVVILLGLWWFTASQPGPTFDQTNTPSGTTKKTSNVTPAAAQQKVGAMPIATAQKSSTVAAIAAGVENGARFSSIFIATGVNAEVAGNGPYTIFVPTDGAFSRLAPGTITGMTGAQLKRLVEYHVIVGRAIDADAVSSGTMGTLSKDALNFTVNSDKSVSVGSAKIIRAYAASNGVVYVIDGVLLPPQSMMIVPK